jgi:diguanylate cyclase (GGDEF)-like protein
VQEIADVRDRAARAAGRADRLSAAGLGLGYLLVALTCTLFAGIPSAQEAVTVVLLGALYVVAYRTEFVAAGGSTVPTEPVLVGLLLATPLPLVPLVVLIALQIGGVGVQETGSRAHDLLARMISGWHCLGPVAVLWIFPVPQPALSAWPVYLLALVAQFGFDAGSAAIRSWALGVPPVRLAAPLRWTFTVDFLLAPLGLCVVVAAAGEPAGLALLAAPIGLVRLLARDRSRQLEAAVTLGTAFTAVHEEARVDALTGLANRRAWAEAVDGAGARLADDDLLVAVVLIADVDGLKKINDRHGHDVGDELIRAVAATLAAAAPDDAVVARLGGDEFGILALVPIGDQVVGTLLADVRAALTAHPGVRNTRLSASLGVAACPPAADVPGAVTVADLAAAEDKVLRKAGRG